MPLGSAAVALEETFATAGNVQEANPGREERREKKRAAARVSRERDHAEATDFWR